MNAIVAVPPDAEGHQRQGLAALKAGQFEEAAASFRRALEARPDWDEPHNHLGVALMEQGRLAEAREHLERAVALRPDCAEAHNNLGNVLRRLGRLEEAAASYREALRLRPEAPDYLNHLGITLLRLKRPKEAAERFREALRFRPGHQQALNNLGVALADQNRMTEAASVYRLVLRARPDSPETHNNLGVALAARGHTAEAVEHYRTAARLKPAYPEAHNNLGNALRNEGKLDEALSSLEEAIRLKPDYAEAHNNRAVALIMQGRPEDAVPSYQEAIRLKPDYADAHLNLALAWLLQGDFDRGWPEYEWRFQVKNLALRPVPQPRWDGSPLEGRTVLLRAEQGLGDSLQFIRYARLIRRQGGTVLFECPPRLVPLLRGCPEIAQLVPQGSPLPDFDVHLPLLSLPLLFRTTLESVPGEVPYLSADPALVERWRGPVCAVPGFRVGVAWQGSTTYQGDRHRSPPLRHFAPLARLPGVRLISLQKGAGAEQLAELADRWGVADLGEPLDEGPAAFVDTAAVMQHLDLVITSDTALAHLAGALGVAVWVALPMARDWRWLLGRGDSPWYPTMRLFRQRRWGDWDDVFERIAAELESHREGAPSRAAGESAGAEAAVHRRRGAAWLKQGRLEEAVTALRRAVQLDPASAEAHNDFGMALGRQGRWPEALPYFREAVRLSPDCAEAHNNLGDALQNLGEADEAVGCYRQALRLDPGAVETHYNLGVALAERGQLDEAVACYREALRLWPEFDLARQLLDVALEQQGKPKEGAAPRRSGPGPGKRSADDLKRLGLGLARVGKREEALTNFREALRLAPDDADAHFHSGDALRHLGRYVEAEAAYLRALQLQPDRADAANHLGITLLRQGRPADAEGRFRESLRANPDSTEAHNNLGVALEQLGKVDEAVAAFRESIRLKPDAPDTHKNLALVLLLRGDFERGWAEYEWRFRANNTGFRPVPQPRWDGSPLEGRTVLLRAEQGLGDTLQFIRYARLVQRRGGNVLFECHPRLVPLLRRCPGIAQFVPLGSPLPDFDVHLPMFSLPAVFGTTLESVPAEVPYLSADPALVERWRGPVCAVPGFRVGVAWQGSTTYQGDRHRSPPLRHFAPLARLPGVRLISLQKGAGAEQLAELAGRWGAADLGKELDEGPGAFVDTAAAMQHLDLLVTSDSAIAHLAGALGVPVWVALPMARDWRWLLSREDSPWYPTMRLFRQRRWGDWDDVFERIAAELERRLSPGPFRKPVLAEVAPGELIDRITLLEVERGRTADAAKLEDVRLELGSLLAALARSVKPCAELDRLRGELKGAHESLREAEEGIRHCERDKDFGERFAEWARSANRESDRRAALKGAINDLLSFPAAGMELRGLRGDSVAGG